MSSFSTQPQADDSRKSDVAMHFPLWISIVVIIGILLLFTGAAISKIDPTILTNGSRMTESAHVYADYMFSRNFSLAVMLLLLLLMRARRMLAGFMLLVALIQFVDIGNDLARGAFLLAPGLLLFAILLLIGAWRLFGQAFWRINTWRDL